MDQIWSIIGLSSLIAAVVTVSLGIVRDIFVEKYRFKRQSEAGFIQSQIQVYSQIHLLLARIEKRATEPLFFGEASTNLKEINDIIKTNSYLLTSRIKNEWLSFMAMFQRGFDVRDNKDRLVLGIALDAKKDEILSLIIVIINRDLIPKYRKIVGETVPLFG